MKKLDAGIEAHLKEGATTLSWCWRIARTDGEVLGFTDHDRALTFDGTIFEPESGSTACGSPPRPRARCCRGSTGAGRD